MEAEKKNTLEDLLTFPEDARVELIHGTIIQRAMPRPKHAQAQSWVTRCLAPYDRKSSDDTLSGWWILTEIGVFYQQQDCFVHDLAGWKRARLPALPDASFITVAPDWVCEILSPNNKKNDTIKKFRTLQTYKVPYYWIVDPDEETITVYRYEQDRYAVSCIVESGEKARLEPFTDIEIDIGVIFGH